MHELNVKYTGESACRIIVGKRLLENIGEYIKSSTGGQTAVIITDSNVGPVYAQALQQKLELSGICTSAITVPAGESFKTLDTAAGIYHELSRLNADRGTVVIALGGGVIGDIAGYVAATYLRGLPLIQLPTSLLAMVDSSIGGKTGVNLGELKNQIGVFYHASLVVSDTAVLTTLPHAEFTNGLAEIIKSAVIADGEFFSFLEDNIENLSAGQQDLLEEAIFHTGRIKTQIVSEDEKDASVRQLLNFGHTIGHAIETASSLNVRHGQAVAAGMVAAAKISCKLGLLDSNGYTRLKNLLTRAGLPEKIGGIDSKRVIQAIKHDKKIKNGKINFVLIKEPGKGIINRDVTQEMIIDLIEGKDG